MGAHTITNRSFISHYERYVSTTQGRDKLLRLVQHFARLCSWTLCRAGNRSHAVATLRHVIREISLARKLLRTGNFLYLFENIVHASRKPAHDPIIHFASIGRYIALSSYLILDASTLPDALGVWKWDKAKVLQKETARLWLISLIFSLVIQLRTLQATCRAVIPAPASVAEPDGAIQDCNRVVAQYVNLLPHSNKKITRIILTTNYIHFWQ